MKEFWDDKTREQSSIDDAIRLLEKDGFKQISLNDNNAYDILVEKDDKQFKVEVKQDFTCYKTNNIGVEYECRGKESGIMVSKADIYIYKIHQDPYKVSMAKNEVNPAQGIKIIRVMKNKLKSCINELLDGNQKHMDINDRLEQQGILPVERGLDKPSKRGFEWREVTDSKGNKYEVQVRFINGGDIGSNSLNVLFERNSFIENFVQKHLENRPRTEDEQTDLNATLDNAKKRNDKKFKSHNIRK